MSLDIGEALSEGFRRTFTPAGLTLAVAFVLIGAVSTVAYDTILADVFDSIIEVMRTQRGPGEDEFTRQEIQMTRSIFRGQTPFALGIPVSVAGLLIAITAVLAETTRLLTVRVAFPERTDGASGRGLRGNLLIATLNGIVGGIVVGLIVAIGFIIGLIGLVIGGFVVALFLAMSLVFLRQEIAIEDKSFVSAMTDSWSLAKGNRIELLALVVLIVIVAFVVSVVPATIVGFVSPTASVVVGILIGGVTAVFGTAVVTRAYAQLRAERAAEIEKTNEWVTY